LKKHFFILLTFLFIVQLSLSSFVIAQSLENESILIKGGAVMIGADNGLENESPRFETNVISFYIDHQSVTVAQFRLFVRLTGYFTDAEKASGGLVWNETKLKYTFVENASWEYPRGRNMPQAKDEEPVTQVSYYDAKAYAAFLKKRLPTEFEWEYAAQQAAKYGLAQMDGVLWQWTESWYRPYNSTSGYSKKLYESKSVKGGTPIETDFRTSVRKESQLYETYSDLGFRCAKSLNE
jgi:formylglycine-generating enzyme required for sulfatase activity